MDIVHAIVLGIIEGVTEFLPISSTGHLTIAEKLFGYQIDAPGIAAFTAVVQIGAILAAVIYFRRDIARVVRAWVIGLFLPDKRHSFDYRVGWYVIVGSIPIGVVGFILQGQIETVFRGLWVIAVGLIVWSIVMFIADRYGRELRHEHDITWRDTLIIGIVQCFALVPGVSRSGATIAAGLFRHIDRVAATRLSFFLGIPALIAAGTLEAVTQSHHITTSVGWPAMIAGIVAAFIVGYIAIAWLLKFISSHTFTPFVVYRLVLAGLIIVLLTSGAVAAN